ncbi:MAG: RHS repeat-associated core domain-containing protein [Candidatus Obscuribacter sp.]|nr:RHS repeat-associated core domain-containing protein [Candidatus Obscuribacter sp.]
MLGMLGLFGYPVNETPPFGAPPSKIPDAPFLFEYGQRTPSPSETALKLTLAPYRAYDASIGWWLSRDPIEEDDGFNLYAYVGNVPVNYFDELGLQGVAGRIVQCIIKGLRKAPKSPASKVRSPVAGKASGGNKGNNRNPSNTENKTAPERAKKSKKSDREKAIDRPSWSKGEKPLKGEKPTEFAKRVMDDRYGMGNYDPRGEEFSQLKKWATRGQ